MAKLPPKPMNVVHEYFPVGTDGQSLFNKVDTVAYKMVDVDGTEVDTSKPGMSNAGKYKNVPAGDFAGPHGTYPINTEKRGKSAIKLAHNAANPEAIKAKVYKKYPNLKPEIGVQSPDNNSKTA